MQKVLVAEIGSQTTTVNAFGDFNAENPRLLGQGLSPTTVLDGDAGIGLRFLQRHCAGSTIINIENGASTNVMWG